MLLRIELDSDVNCDILRVMSVGVSATAKQAEAKSISIDYGSTMPTIPRLNTLSMSAPQFSVTVGAVRQHWV